ncbi:MAG: acyl-CoA thioester hydrolase/BAAT C-terminal domain-containing protein [Pseudomonadota bacterium]
MPSWLVGSVLVMAAAGVNTLAAEPNQTSSRAGDIIAHDANIADGVGYRLYEQRQPGGGQAPLAFYIGGSEGGLPTQRHDVPAALLKAGFSVATIGYFGFDGGPAQLSEIDLNAVFSQVKAATRHYGRPQRCVGVIGVSKGAELSLLMAVHTDAADVYVAAVPSSVAWQASNITLRTKSSWRLGEEPVPFLRYPWFSKGALDVLMGGSDFRAIHEAALKRKRAVANASIPVEIIATPVLLMSAKRDHVWPSYEMSQAMMSRLDSADRAHHFDHVAYDLNHYIFDHETVIAAAIAYLKKQLSAEGACGH